MGCSPINKEGNSLKIIKTSVEPMNKLQVDSIELYKKKLQRSPIVDSIMLEKRKRDTKISNDKFESEEILKNSEIISNIISSIDQSEIDNLHLTNKNLISLSSSNKIYLPTGDSYLSSNKNINNLSNSFTILKCNAENLNLNYITFSNL